jgi:hypothetical protein
MNFERKLCALLLQDPTTYLPRVKRTKLDSSDIDDSPSKIIFEAILNASDLGEVTTESVTELIKQSGLSNSEANLHINIVEELSNASVEEVEFTFSYLAQHKEDSLLRRYLKQAATELKTGSEASRVKQQLIDQLSKIKTEDVSLKEYEENFLGREQERHSRKAGVGMIRLSDEFRHLKRYFPYGFAPGTINIIMGATNAGKSVFLANLVEMSSDKNSRLNVLYVFSENQEVEALSRLDAVVLNKPYKELYEQYLSREEALKIKGRTKEGAGKIFYCKPEFENFTSVTIENALDAAIDQGHRIDAIFIDSPDHMKPLRVAGQHHIDKPQVWKDLKAVAERYNVCVFGTWPLREEYSTPPKAGKERPPLAANSGAGGQDVGRVADNILAFVYDEAVDDLMSHRLFTVTKCRDGVRDFLKLRYMIRDSLRFVHEEDYKQYLPKDFDEVWQTAPEPEGEFESDY